MRFYDGLLGHDPDIFYNSTGHRCKELSELNFRNYVLFAGDNVGLGLDKPIEETYPYLVANSLKMDYYNLSIFNGGLDATKVNLISWFTRFKEKPKAVVISCEFINSMLCTKDNVNYWAGDLNDEYVSAMMTAGNESGFFTCRNIMATVQLNSVITCPVFQVVFPNKEPIIKENIFNTLHEGPIYDYSAIANKLVSSIKGTFISVRP